MRLTRKEGCPVCKSRKIDLKNGKKTCRVYGHQWRGKGKKSRSRKEKTRFR
jgi:uncharacterized Zn finger protein (UPF0148 family)